MTAQEFRRIALSLDVREALTMAWANTRSTR